MGEDKKCVHEMEPGGPCPMAKPIECLRNEHEASLKRIADEVEAACQRADGYKKRIVELEALESATANANKELAAARHEQGEHIAELEAERKDTLAALEDSCIKEYVMYITDAASAIRRSAIRIAEALPKEDQQCPECRSQLVIAWSHLNEPARELVCPRCLQDHCKELEAGIIEALQLRTVSYIQMVAKLENLLPADTSAASTSEGVDN